MNELIKIKISDFNRESWPSDFSEFVAKYEGKLVCVESEMKLCSNCDYLFFENDLLKFHSSELGVMSFDFKEYKDYHNKCNYSISKEPLAKALAIKGNDKSRVIWDTTCGTGKDSVLIQHFGAKVVAFERNVAVYLLLKDAQRHFDLGIDLFFGDARSFENLERPDVIYYDPMYPSKKKSALARKEMRIFKEIVGDDPDSSDFLAWAKTRARDRVVVKRPLEASPIHEKPSADYKGKSTRYDMYKIF